MSTYRSRGRAVGVLLVCQLAAGLILPFVLILRLNVGSPDYLAAAAANGGRVRAAVLVSFLGAALSVAIGAVTFPVIRRYSESLAVALVAACSISAALDAVHGSTVMAMLAMVRNAANVPVGDASHLAAAAAVYSTRVTVHYVQLVAIAGWLSVFYLAMLRWRLVPRPVAALGLAAVVLQFSGVTLAHYVGYPMQGALAYPLAPVHTLTAVWLIVRGFPAEEIAE